MKLAPVRVFSCKHPLRGCSNLYFSCIMITLKPPDHVKATCGGCSVLNFNLNLIFTEQEVNKTDDITHNKIRSFA